MQIALTPRSPKRFEHTAQPIQVMIATRCECPAGHVLLNARREIRRVGGVGRGAQEMGGLAYPMCAFTVCREPLQGAGHASLLQVNILLSSATTLQGLKCCTTTEGPCYLSIALTSSANRQL